MSSLSNLIPSLDLPYGEVGLNVVAAIVIVAVAIYLSRMLTRLIRTQLEGTSVGGVSLFVNIARAVVAVLAISFAAESLFDIEMGGLVQALGVTSLVVSLGLQDFIKNVVAGIQIVIFHLITVGDQIVVGDRRGEVMDINWHQTTIRDKDANLHLIPNSQIMGDSFTLLTKDMAYRQILECEIIPGLDLDRVAEDIEQLAADVLTEKGLIAEGYSPQVQFIGSTAYGTKASIRIFIKDIEYTTRSLNAVMRAIAQRGYLSNCTQPAHEDWA